MTGMKWRLRCRRYLQMSIRIGTLPHWDTQGTGASNKKSSNVIHCTVSAACMNKTCSYQKVFRSKL
jgi:hypothetical protein